MGTAAAAMGVAPGMPGKPGKFLAGIPLYDAARRMRKAANFKHQSRRIKKGVLFGAVHLQGIGSFRDGMGTKPAKKRPLSPDLCIRGLRTRLPLLMRSIFALSKTTQGKIVLFLPKAADHNSDSSRKKAQRTNRPTKQVPPTSQKPPEKPQNPTESTTKSQGLKYDTSPIPKPKPSATHFADACLLQIFNF